MLWGAKLSVITSSLLHRMDKSKANDCYRQTGFSSAVVTKCFILYPAYSDKARISHTKYTHTWGFRKTGRPVSQGSRYLRQCVHHETLFCMSRKAKWVIVITNNFPAVHLFILQFLCLYFQVIFPETFFWVNQLTYRLIPPAKYPRLLHPFIYLRLQRPCYKIRAMYGTVPPLC